MAQCDNPEQLLWTTIEPLQNFVKSIFRNMEYSQSIIDEDVNNRKLRVAQQLSHEHP